MIRDISLPNGTIKLIIPDDIEGVDELKELNKEDSTEANSAEADDEDLMSSCSDRKIELDCQFPADFALQFKCADCCKKVLFFGDFFELTIDLVNDTSKCRGKNGRFILETFNDGKLVEKQVMDEIFIFNFCSLEILVVEIDPKIALNPGLSKIAVELECGVCCKKVLNIRRTIGYPPFVLIPPRNESLLVKTINGGKIVNKQCAKLMIINPRRVCSVERNAIEVDF